MRKGLVVASVALAWLSGFVFGALYSGTIWVAIVTGFATAGLTLFTIWLDSPLSFEFLKRVWPRLTPEQQAKIERNLGVDADTEKLVDRIMALPKEQRAALRIMVEELIDDKP